MVSIRFVDLKVKCKKDTDITFKVLFDSGASSTIVAAAMVCHLKTSNNDGTTLSTALLYFSSNQKYCAKMILAEFNPTTEITQSIYVAKNQVN